MSEKKHHHEHEPEKPEGRRERHFEAEVIDELYYQRTLLQRVIELLHCLEPRRLSMIYIVFQTEGENIMGLTLTTAGQTATATVQGFDQLGNAMPADFKLPVATFSVDDSTGAIVKAVDNGDGTATVTAVANGTANLSASLTTAEGLALSTSDSIVVDIATPPPTPVLSSIKIAFA